MVGLVRFTLTGIGRYVIRVFLVNEHVGQLPAKSPLVLEAVEDAGPLSLSNTFAAGPNLLEAFAGVASEFTITMVGLS